jgi:hypothetical protein
MANAVKTLTSMFTSRIPQNPETLIRAVSTTKPTSNTDITTKTTQSRDNTFRRTCLAVIVFTSHSQEVTCNIKIEVLSLMFLVWSIKSDLLRIFSICHR